MADILPYLERIRARFDQPDVRVSFQGFDRTIQFIFPDLKRNFVLHIAQDGNASLSEETLPQPNISVTTNSDTLAGILDRKVNPELAFITRKLKVSGRMEDLMKLQKLL
ncbi:MAG TPA: SCP2 sterol-binding domain-containing protein [Ktedonobacteraceae bacterium]|jgi:putative sterol carrier protein|nr:SCP2 sterol-binding domain-containing protein [Ktedonobacteraceae bacterium]